METCPPHGGARCCPVASLHIRTDPPDTQRRSWSRAPRTRRGAGLAWAGSGPVAPARWVRAPRLPVTGTASGRGRLRVVSSGRAAASTLSSPRRPRSGGRPRAGGERAAFPRPWPLQSFHWAALRPRGRGASRPPAGPEREAEGAGRGRPGALLRPGPRERGGAAGEGAGPQGEGRGRRGRAGPQGEGRGGRALLPP